MKILEPGPEAFTHLLVALQRARSVAQENGTLDLMAPHDDMPGLEPWTADPRTLDLVLSLASGERECDTALWLNLCRMVEQSPSWDIGLIVRNVRMPEPGEVLGLTG